MGSPHRPTELGDLAERRSCGVEPVVRGTAQSRATPDRLDAPVQRIPRRATNSTRSRSHKKPGLWWATPTDMATAMAMPASAATGSSAGHDGRCCGAAAGVAAGAWVPDRAAGRSRRRFLSSPWVRAARACPARSSNSSAVEDRLEVLAQLRQDRVTVGVGSPHLSSGVILQRGVHRAAVLSSRERIAPLYCAGRRGVRANAGCHRPGMTSVTARRIRGQVDAPRPVQ